MNIQYTFSSPSFAVIGDFFRPILSEQHKKIVVVAAVALGCLAALYLVKRYYFCSPPSLPQVQTNKMDKEDGEINLEEKSENELEVTSLINDTVDIEEIDDDKTESVLSDSDKLLQEFPVLLSEMSDIQLEEKLFNETAEGKKMIDHLPWEWFDHTQMFHLARLIQKKKHIISSDSPIQPYCDLIGSLSGKSTDEIIENINQLTSYSEEERKALLANLIALDKISLNQLKLKRDGLLSLCPHLRYIDLREFNDPSLGKEMINSCFNPYELIVKNSLFLEDIQVLSYCVSLDCSSISCLTKIPELPVCKCLNCHSCVSLIALPKLPVCDYLYCSYCVSLKEEIPKLPFGVVVYCGGFAGRVSECLNLNVHLEELSEEPIQILKKLGTIILFKDYPFPNITYFEKNIQSEGVDLGGVRRDFVSRLCESLFNQTEKNGDQVRQFLKTDENHYPQIPRIAQGCEIEFYRTIGNIMALCYHGRSSLVIGSIFPQVIYDCMVMGERDDQSVALELAAKEMSWLTPFLLNQSEVIPEITSDQFVYLTCLAESFELNITTVEELNIHRAELLEKLRTRIEEEARFNGVLFAILIMTKEMKRKLGNKKWKRVVLGGGVELKNRIEGALEKKCYLEKSSFSI